VSGVEAVQIERPGSVKSPQNGGWRSKHQKALLERAAADGLTQEAMEALRTSEGWQRWLQVRSRLSSHGLHNQLLIAHQRPNAQRVAGSREWLTSGYEVRSDETAIRVWAYVPASKTALREWEKAGSPPEEKPEGELRLVPVFDQDQVSRQQDAPEPEEQQDPHSRSSDASKLVCLLGQLIKFASEIGSPVNFEPIASAVRGYHEPGTGEIVIDASPDFPPAARAERLIYELAMVLIDEDPRRRGLKFCDGEREVVARSVVYCVCALARSTGYRGQIAVSAEWAADNALAVRYAAVVDRVAARLEAALLSGLEGGRE
jgi:hypothetical protein